MSMRLSKEKKVKSQSEDFQNEEKIETTDAEYVKEYLYFLVFGVIFCLFLSIISYEPTDPNMFHVVSGSIHKYANYLGLVGANFSEWCFQIFGFGSFVFLVVFMIQLFSTFGRPKNKSRFYLRLFGYPQFILFYLSFTSGLIPFVTFRGVRIYTGGFIGDSLFRFVSHYLGNAGALAAFFVGMLSSMTLCLGIRPITTIIWLFKLLPFSKEKKFFNDVALGIQEHEAMEEHKYLIDDLKQTTNQNHVKIQDSFEGKNSVSSDFTKKNSQKSLSMNTGFVHGRITSSKKISPENFNEMLSLLEYHKDKNPKQDPMVVSERLNTEARLIEEKLNTFGIQGKVLNSQNGPVVNIHEYEPASGIKINKIISLQDDLSLALKAHNVSIGIQAGKNTLGIEIPSAHREVVSLREILESKDFSATNYQLPIVLGKGIDGTPLISDLSQMPHLLVAGATGSGKSVCINSMIMSLLMCKTPAELRLILIDPKMLELSNYDGIGHLLTPVITDPHKATLALSWALTEMDRRYMAMRDAQVRNIVGYNEWVESELGGSRKKGASFKNLSYMPYIVIVADELSDLMMVASKTVEESIQRLAQKARAAGIHLILATQRPSVDVITGVIKANLPTRISFQVTSRHDSRTIIENIGAERLLGKGDMLYLHPGSNKTLRAQCALVTDREINSLSDNLRLLYPPLYDRDIMKEVERSSSIHN